jgi:hypothetical protein
MRENAKRRASVEHITDEENPNAGGKGTDDEAITFFVICVSLMILIVGVLAYIRLYLRVS